MEDPIPTAVKICGITSCNQAIEIARLGADAVGVIGVQNSKRFASEKTRREIFSNLLKFNSSIDRVWVVANHPFFEIAKGLQGEGVPSIVQLHGEETEEDCLELRYKYPNIKWWKAIRVRKEEDLALVNSYKGIVDGLLLDAWSPKILGGTGERLPLDWLTNKKFNVPWWLAGGISAEWIPQVLDKVNPYGLDASSRLEISPGIKNIQAVKSLIEAIKTYNKKLEN